MTGRVIIRSSLQEVDRLPVWKDEPNAMMTTTTTTRKYSRSAQKNEKKKYEAVQKHPYPSLDVDFCLPADKVVDFRDRGITLRSCQIKP